MLSGAEAHAQVNVTQEHNNSSRDGVYIDAVFTLSAAENLTRDLNLNGIISGNVYAQPLKDEAAVRTLATMREAGERMPGFGHRLHTKDPRTARLFELAREAGIDGAHMQAARNEPCRVQWHFHDRAHARTDRARDRRTNSRETNAPNRSSQPWL